MLFYFENEKIERNVDQRLLSQMRICSFDLECEKYGLQIDFADMSQDIFVLKKEPNFIYSLFHIPNSKRYSLKIYMPRDRYDATLHTLKNRLKVRYLIALVITLILSALFSLYALYPLHKALKLTQEFVRDILHDVNTPLSSIRLNVNMIKPSNERDAKKITRINRSIENILVLQENLKAYIKEHKLQKELFNIATLLEDRVENIAKIYTSVHYSVHAKKYPVRVNKDAMTRIIDNLLTNAGKYNKEDGFVKVGIKDGVLSIEDSGIGIKDTKRIFDRFYKENERGVGIGLNIVKKLTHELGLRVEVSSIVGQGTTFYIDLSKIAQK